MYTLSGSGPQPQEVTSIEQQIPVDHLRPLPPPFTRHAVSSQAKMAPIYIDLIGDDDSPLTSTNQTIDPQGTASLTLSPKIVPVCNPASNSREETPTVRDQLFSGDYASAMLLRCTLQENAEIKHHDAEFQVLRANEADNITLETRNTSEPSMKKRKLSFINEDENFSRENAQDTTTLDENKLARKLITSDKLRTRANPLYPAPSHDQVESFGSQRRVGIAATWREQIEREGVEKSRALREAAELRRCSQADVTDCKNSLNCPEILPKPLSQITRDEFDMLSIFNFLNPPNSSNASRQERASSAGSAAVDESGTSLLSSTSGTEPLYEDEEEDNYSDSNLFCGPEKSKIIPGSTQDALGRSEFSLRQTPHVLHAQTSPLIENKSNLREMPYNPSDCEQNIESLLDFKKIAKRHKQQNVAPRTSFVHRHRSDGFNDTASSRKFKTQPLSNHQSPVRSGFASLASAETVPTPKATARKINSLQKAPNDTGGLALLARKADLRWQSSHEGTLQERQRSDAFKPPVSQPSRSISENFQVDFSRYKRLLSEEEKRIITSHEFLKERKRDLELLYQTYVKFAQFLCNEGQITAKMEEDLETIEEFIEIVLKNGEVDRFKRLKVQSVKGKYTRKEPRPVRTNELQTALDMIGSKETMQQIEDELKFVEKEMEVVARRRYDNSIHVTKPTKKGNVKKDGTGNVNMEDVASPQSQKRPGIDALSSLYPAQPPRPKRGTEEYRQSQRDAQFRFEDRRYEALKAKLHDLNTQTGIQKTDQVEDITCGPARDVDIADVDRQSDISEEDEGEEYDPTRQLASKKTANPLRSQRYERERSLEEIDLLEAERQWEETSNQPQIPSAGYSKPLDSGTSQSIGHKADEHALETVYEDTASNTSNDSSADSVSSSTHVYQYRVFGAFSGISLENFDLEITSSLDAAGTGKLGVFLHSENAQKRVRSTIDRFSKFYHDAVALAEQAEDDELVAKLGDPGSVQGAFRGPNLGWDQTLEFPAAACRVWIEKKCIPAKSREERRVRSMDREKIYSVLWQKRDGVGKEGEAVTWKDIKHFKDLHLANIYAGKLMAAWYRERLEAGYAALQRDALEETVRRLAGVSPFSEDDEFERPGKGKEGISVWVDEKWTS